MKKLNPFICATALALASSLLVPASYANVLTPGETGAAPDVFTGGFGTLVASETEAMNAITFTASVTEDVYRSSTGTLNFVYQVSDIGSSGILEDLTAYNFNGFTTDVGYEAVSGDLAPCTVGRSATGTTVSFDYPNAVAGACDFNHGVTSDLLVIETNATNYTVGTFSGIDGSTSTVVGYMPTSATPEPSSLMLLGTGLAGLAGFTRRKFRR